MARFIHSRRGHAFMLVLDKAFGRRWDELPRDLLEDAWRALVHQLAHLIGENVLAEALEEGVQQAGQGLADHLLRGLPDQGLLARDDTPDHFENQGLHAGVRWDERPRDFLEDP